MTEVTFILKDGSVETIDIPQGMPVMKGAVLNDIPGIDGECGGACACATCHVYIEKLPHGSLPPMSETENGLLGGVAAERRENSRLACQIVMQPGLEGLVVRIPERQS
jgi:ferredoxin, 2Fe-2S